MRIGRSDYAAQVVVAVRGNGDMLLYDLLNIKPAEIQEKSQMQQAAHPAKAEADRWTAPSVNSIPQSVGESNTHFFQDGSETRDRAIKNSKFQK